MQTVDQSFTLLEPMPEGQALRIIETVGRVAYQSEPKGDPAAFVRMLIKRGHDSVLEHVSISARILTDRGIAQELTRHRIASYTMESTRYVRYNDGLTVIEPPGLSLFSRSAWRDAIIAAEMDYATMIRDMTPPQLARSVLPLCLACELTMTANVRQWRHVLRQRSAPAAHPQMCELMGLALVELRLHYPVLFGDLGADA